MGPLSCMRSVVDRSVVMRRIPVYAFWPLENCPRLPSDSVILLQGATWPHTWQQTTFAWAMSFQPPHSPHMTPSDFHFSAFEGAIVRISLHQRWKHQTCYHYVAGARGTYVLEVRNGKKTNYHKHSLKKNSLSVTLSLYIVSFLYKNLHWIYGYCQLTFRYAMAGVMRSSRNTFLECYWNEFYVSKK